jgi:hypothetical protein
MRLGVLPPAELRVSGFHGGRRPQLQLGVQRRIHPK